MIGIARLSCKAVCQVASTAVATLALLVATVNYAEAGSSPKERSKETITTRTAGEPIMAIVSLRSQRITIYDTDGWIMRAPVSSGQAGRETPAGIFSVIQKDAEHHSNLYDDAYMPHMQRLTWSGIALHGGPLPGHPASHGCIRLPYDFAAHLFDLTKLGMRVIVAPSDVAPVSITHPVLFQPKSDARDVAAARLSEAEEAAKKADQARLAVFTASREVAQATVPLRRMRNLKVREEERLADAERSITSVKSIEAKEATEAAKASSAAKIAELEAQLAPAEAELQPKINALAAAREAAAAAEVARAQAVEAANALARTLEPVSVLISRRNSAPLCPTSLSAHLGNPDHNPRSRSTDWHAYFHRRGALRQKRNALERCFVSRTFECPHSRDPRADAPSARCPRQRNGSTKRQSGARPHHHTRGHNRSYRPDGIPPILAYHFRRRTRLGNRPRHRVCDSYGRRAARWARTEAKGT